MRRVADRAGYSIISALSSSMQCIKLTSDQNLFWMNSLGISNDAMSARLRSISASLEPASFVWSPFPAEAMSSRIEDKVAIFVTDQLDRRIWTDEDSEIIRTWLLKSLLEGAIALNHGVAPLHSHSLVLKTVGP